MMNHKLEKLTEQEKIYAECNHNIIYSFLHKFGYSIEEFYNVAVMGYLLAVQIYHRREDLRKEYSFMCISYQYMRREIANYLRAMETQKRKPMEIIISLDAEYADMENLYNCIGGKSLESEIMEDIEIAELLESFTDIQKDIMKLKLEGYSNKEIYVSLGIGSTTFYKEMQKIKTLLTETLVR